MLDGKATIVLSYSVGFQTRVADPVAQRLEQHGFRTVRVGEEPLPPNVESDPNSKVEWFFSHADMAVFLATPDDRLESGEVHTRPNIIDEHRLGQQLPHLHHRLLVFKAAGVKLPSNINPVYERLPLDDPDWIVGKIIDQARSWGVLPAAARVEERDVTPESSEERTPKLMVSGAEDESATTETIAALTHAVDAVLGAAPNARQLWRAELSIAGLNAAAGSGDPLGVHLANRLFARRHEIHPGHGERQLLLRTYLRHSLDDNVPGIFWIKELNRSQLVQLLIGFARDDADSQVRAEALRILGRLGVPVAVDAVRRLVAPFLSSDDFSLRGAALEFLSSRRERSLHDVLDDAKLLERDRHRVSQTRALLDLRMKPTEVMERYIDDAYIRPAEVERELLRAARRVRRESVLAALTSTVSKVRLLGIRMADQKGMMSLSLGLELIERDRSSRVRIAALRALVGAREPVDLGVLDRAADKRDDDLDEFAGFDEKRDLALDICMRLPRDDLEAGIRWSAAHGPACYEALGIRDEQWAEANVRADLRNNFEALRHAGRDETLAVAIKETEARIGRTLTNRERRTVGESVDEHWKEWTGDAKLGRFIASQFQRAALRVLVARGRRDDVHVARKFADSEDQDIRAEALRLFERFGTAHDAATVLSMTDQFYGDENRQRAAEVALRLAYKKNKLEVLRTLRQNHTVRLWAVARLADVEGGLDEAVELLQADHAEVRVAAAKVVWDAVEPARAEGLLSIYMSGRHYYNVVRTIDRRLYAPAWLRKALPE